MIKKSIVVVLRLCQKREADGETVKTLVSRLYRTHSEKASINLELHKLDFRQPGSIESRAGRGGQAPLIFFFVVEFTSVFFRVAMSGTVLQSTSLRMTECVFILDTYLHWYCSCRARRFPHLAQRGRCAFVEGSAIKGGEGFRVMASA